MFEQFKAASAFCQKIVSSSSGDEETHDGDLLVKWTVSSGDNVPMMVTEYENINE